MTNARLRAVGFTGLALALAWSCTAMAGQFTHEGVAENDPNTAVWFNVVENDKGKAKKAKDFFGLLPYHCDDGDSSYDTWYIAGKLKVKKGKKFRGKVVWKSGDAAAERAFFNQVVTYKLKGKLKPDGTARGTIDATNAYDEPTRGPVLTPVRCYTGRLDWTAEETGMSR